MKRKAFLVMFLLILAFTGTAITLYAQKSSDTATTKIGNPKEGASGWPTVGRITQGPKGPAGHLASGLIALDIANAPGTPIYATFDGTAYAYTCSSDGACNESYGRIGNFVKLVPNSHPSAIALFGHMMTVTVADGTQVKIGDQLGLMGSTGYVDPPGPAGTHLHYEFRRLPMTPPNIPTTITPETCGACSPAQIP